LRADGDEAAVTESGAALVHGGVASRQPTKRCSSASKLIMRDQGGVGVDGEAGGDVGKALEGRR
jgi:hypothetical protein